MDNGNEFQSLGADDLNALSPSVTLNLTDAGVNNVPIWFLRLYLDGLETVRRSLRYLGAESCKHLKVKLYVAVQVDGPVREDYYILSHGQCGLFFFSFICNLHPHDSEQSAVFRWRHY